MKYLPLLTFLGLMLPLMAQGQRATQSLIYETGTLYNSVKLSSNEEGASLLLVDEGVGQSIILIQIDRNGQIDWAFEFDNIGLGTEAIGLSQGRWLLYGSSTSPQNGSSDYEVHLLDSDGNILWGRAFGNEENETPIGAFQTSENRVIIAGNSQGGPANIIQEAALLNLDQGSLITMATVGPQQTMGATTSALIGNTVYFLGNSINNAIVTPHLCSIDTGFVRTEAYNFPNMISMTGHAMAEDESGNPVIALGYGIGFGGAIVFSLDLSQDPTNISGKYIVNSPNTFRVSKMLSTRNGFLLGGSLTNSFPLGEAFVLALDKTLNPIRAFVDTSVIAPSLSGLARINDNRFVMARNINLLTLGTRTIIPGISLKEISGDGIAECPMLGTSFQQRDTLIRISSVSPQSFIKGNFLTRNVALTRDAKAFETEASCVPASAQGGFSRSDSVICFGDSISLTDNSIDATTLRWYFTNAQLDSFVGSTPPTLLPTRAGEVRITQIAERGLVSDTVIKVVKVMRVPYLQLPADTIICLGDTLRLEAKGFIEDEYAWSPAEAVSPSSSRLTSFHPNQSTSIKVEVSNQGLCLISDSFVMDVIPNLSLETSQSTDSICPADTAELSAKPGPYAIRWSTGDTTELIKTINAGTYVVNISNQCFSQEAELKVYDSEACPGQLFIPNAFSPNDDGFNDVWRPGLQFVADMEIWIYSRWGQLVYYENSDSPAWNGRLLEGEIIAGQYFFKAEARMLDGSKENLKGQIILIR